MAPSERGPIAQYVLECRITGGAGYYHVSVTGRPTIPSQYAEPVARTQRTSGLEEAYAARYAMTEEIRKTLAAQGHEVIRVIQL